MRDPTRQAIGVGHVKTFGPIKESNWNGMNTYQFHQNFPGDTIGGHYMKRKRSKENIREAERYSKIVSGIPSVALPPRRDIPWKLPEKGGGGCTAPPDTDQKCYFSRQFSDQVLESFTWSTTLFWYFKVCIGNRTSAQLKFTWISYYFSFCIVHSWKCKEKYFDQTLFKIVPDFRWWGL